MSVAAKPLTAEQFAQLSDDLGPCELIRGEIVVSPPPSFDHGAVCAAVSHYLNVYVRKHDLGRVLSNDSGVVTEREPDTVRGADVAFYSYQAVPKGEHPTPYAKAPPELVVEVRSPSDTWPEIHAKVAEYLTAGVRCVCVVDYLSQTVAVHHAEQPPETFGKEDELRLPSVLGDFALAVESLFD